MTSDTEYVKSTMSSYDSDKSAEHRHGSWSSTNYSFSDSMPSSVGRDYSTGGSSRSAGVESSCPTSISRDSVQDATLPELTQVPWTEGDVLATLQAGKLKDCCGNISIECLQRLSYLLQRALIRIAREAQRLSEVYNKCTKHVVKSACKIILSPALYAEANKRASQSTLFYSMSTKDTNCSTSSLCSLALSIGKHHRWLLEALSIGYVHELAAVYLTAAMEAIIEQTAHLALFENSNTVILKEKQVITTEMLEDGIQRCPALHSLYHPSSHLISSALSLSDVSCSTLSVLSPAVYKTIERNLLTKCASSISELADLVSQTMHHWYPRSARGSTTQLKWSSSAISTLYYFMKCSQSDCCETRSPLICLKAERSYISMPPITQWVRMAATFAEHRYGRLIDSDDVMQTARVLLPSVDCPVRNSRYMDYNSFSIDCEEGTAESVQRQVALSLISSSVAELKQYAASLIRKLDVDYVNEQGMTALMCACARGDDSAVLALLRCQASTEVCVPSTHPACAGWTALCFAVSHGHFSVTKLLLEHGCAVEGSAVSTRNTSETPLQIACAGGLIEIVNLLLRNNADPHQSTLLQSGLEIRNTYNSFTLAASHGQRDVLRRLFGETLQLKGCKLLTLSEMLADSCSEDQCKSELEKSSQLNCQAEQEDDYMVIENDYVTIEDIRQHDCRLAQLKERLTSCNINSLQAALFQAAENGFLDLTLEIHTTGLPWTLYTWYMTLNTAHIMQRKAIVQSLLKDFDSINRADNINTLTEYCLPLMLDIFRDSKNEMISHQLATIFSSLYGPQPLPLLKDIRAHPSPIIDSRYVNSRELADVSFIVEHKTFYAHKVILASASQRFKSMLSNFSGIAMPEIEIRDIGYQTFESVIRYVYEGADSNRLGSMTDVKTIRHILGAAHYFQLDGLKRKCEILLSKSLSMTTCVSIYKAAKTYLCVDLMEICEAYFLQHLSRLLAKSEPFKRMLYSAKVHNRELLHRLSCALATRLNYKSAHTSDVMDSIVSWS